MEVFSDSDSMGIVEQPRGPVNIRLVQLNNVNIADQNVTIWLGLGL